MPELRKQDSIKKWFLRGEIYGFNLKSLPRCEGIAKSTKKRCKKAAVKGQKLCEVHNGSYTPSAPLGNTNALKTGLHTAAAKAERKVVNEFVADSYALIDKIVGNNINYKEL